MMITKQAQTFDIWDDITHKTCHVATTTTALIKRNILDDFYGINRCTYTLHSDETFVDNESVLSLAELDIWLRNLDNL